MAISSRWLQVLIAIGVVLFVINSVVQSLLIGPLSALAPLVSFWWLFLAVGVVGLLVNRYGLSVPSIRTETSIRRQDIIEPTNWARSSKYILRRSFGVGLALSGIVVLVLALALGNTSLAVLWALVLLVGLVWIIAAWRYSQDIVAHHTQTLSVRVPHLFAVHSFHVALRQQAENLGYQIQQNTSPGRGGQSATYDQQVFHANGGFKARKRPVESSRTLLPELPDESYLSDIATTATLGVFSILLGITLLGVASQSLMITLTTSELDLVYVFGPLFLIGGVVVTGYDYFTRTREWGELYCVEEGTVYSDTVSIYERKALEESASNDPTVQSAETSAVLSVTVGAKCTSLYDQSELEAEFEELADSIDAAARDHSLELLERDESIETTDNVVLNR